METKQDATPRAWVGCLGCYNSGALVGKWLEGESCADLVAAGLARVETRGDYTAQFCVRCGGDEFWVLDYENYGDLLGGECSPIEAQEIAQAIATIEGESLNIEAVSAYCSNHHLRIANFDEWRDDYEAAYLGEWDSVEDYAREYVESTGLLDGVAESVARYFDYESFARDLEIGGDIWTSGRHIFFSN